MLLKNSNIQKILTLLIKKSLKKDEIRSDSQQGI